MPFHLVNTIIANGNSSGDCVIDPAAALATNINNLIEDGTCTPLLAVPPQLSVLNDNGGPTRTRPLLSGSPCINAGSSAGAVDPGPDAIPGGGDDIALTTDQRGTGFPRVIATVDIGAFETTIQPQPAPDTTKPVIQYKGKNRLRNGRNTVKVKCTDNAGLGQITLKIPGQKLKKFNGGGATAKTVKTSFKTNKRKIKAKTTAVDTSGNKTTKKRTYKK